MECFSALSVNLSAVSQFLATPWAEACHTLSMEFSRQKYWSGLPSPFPGDLPTQGSNPGLMHCYRTLQL